MTELNYWRNALSRLPHAHYGFNDDPNHLILSSNDCPKINLGINFDRSGNLNALFMEYGLETPYRVQTFSKWFKTRITDKAAWQNILESIKRLGIEVLEVSDSITIKTSHWNFGIEFNSDGEIVIYSMSIN